MKEKARGEVKGVEKRLLRRFIRWLEWVEVRRGETVRMNRTCTEQSQDR